VETLQGDPAATQEARVGTKLIHDRCMRMFRGPITDDRQSSFFGDKLRSRYAIDLDGHVFKDTETLMRLEWKRAIAIRENQLRGDSAVLAAMHEADRALGPIWDRHPNKTYGEIEAMYLAQYRNGNGNGHAAVVGA